MFLFLFILLHSCLSYFFNLFERPNRTRPGLFFLRKILFLYIGFYIANYFLIVSSFVYTIFNFYFGLVPNFRERDFICHEKNSFLFINCSIAILLIRNCLFKNFAKKTNNLLIPTEIGISLSCLGATLFKQIYRTTFFGNLIMLSLFKVCVYTHVLMPNIIIVNKYRMPYYDGKHDSIIF